MKIKSILTYIILIAVSVLFMLFLDGPGGGYLFIVLVLAAVVSVGLCLYTKHNITSQLHLSEDILNKGDSVQLSVIIKKSGIFPTTVIAAEFFGSYNFEPKSPSKVCAVMFGRDECVFKSEYKAIYFGKGRLGLSAFTVSDFLGLCSYRIPISQSMLEVKIYPDITEISSRDNLARNLADAALFDESEDTTQALNSFNGTPGYEHRPYVPGDSLKLINWKLSAKRGELLVRRFESSGRAEQVFILDKKGADNDTNQLTVEAMLGLAAQFAKMELPVIVYMRFDALWEEITVQNTADAAQLRYKMTDYIFADNDVNRFPNSFSKERAVIFSPCADSVLIGFMDEKKSAGKSCSAAACTGSGSDIWKIEKDNDQIRFIG